MPFQYSRLLDREQLEQLCLMNKYLNQVIQKYFGSTPPYRWLTQFASYNETFTIDFNHKSRLPVCKSFASFEQVLPFISPASRIRAKCSCVYFTPNLQIEPFIQQFSLCAHLWLNSSLCIVFDGFNQLSDDQVIAALHQLLHHGIKCTHLTVAMIHNCSTPFYLTHFMASLIKFDRLTLKIIGDRVVQEDLIKYLHSSKSVNGHQLSIFFYLTKQIDDSPEPFGEWQGFQLGQFLTKLNQLFVCATSEPCTYHFTALLASAVELELFDLHNLDTNEQLLMTEVHRDDRLIPVGYSVQRRRMQNNC
uniref:Uncharacterized protein n=1 Tax=Ditylenchus dipsaci TaxID=166011 RepID=A0A915CUI0_9BILA